jgi:hypothetical protein
MMQVLQQLATAAAAAAAAAAGGFQLLLFLITRTERQLSAAADVCYLLASPVSILFAVLLSRPKAIAARPMSHSQDAKNIMQLHCIFA